VILPEHRWATARELWQRAESLGFDHAWTYDHLAWRSLRDSAWFGAIPTLTAAATVTKRMRIGPLVASPNFRHPVPFAKEVCSLDDVSGGRLTLGLGAGGAGFDATVLGGPAWSPRERAERFAEFVALTDRLLREPETSFAGRYYSASEARTYPGCMQRPRVPMAIAATGARSMDLAARYADTWVTTGAPWSDTPLDARDGAAVIARQVEQLDDACRRADRAPSTLARLVLTGISLAPGLASAAAFADTLGHYAEVGVTDVVVHWPRPDDPFAGDVAAFERAVARATGA